jgi:hypothetical protein
MYLIQFPLQPASHAIHPLEKKIEQNGKHAKRPVMKSSVLPVPKAAKIKPQHSLLELTYNVPNHSFSNQRQIPGPLNLTERIFASQNIPIKTHMALGLFDSTGNKIDLIPLKSIIQMRPTFRHDDALFEDRSVMGDGVEDDEEDVDGTSKQTDKEKTSKPVLFQKSENERTILARKSSYAYKKASEEAEEWMELDVHGPGSEERKAVMKSSLMPLSLAVANARDAILVLMIKYGIVQRHLLLKAFEKSGEESVVITAHVLNSLLEMIARKTTNGMEMKLEDDMTFETDFQAIARLHEMYWDKREKELKRFIDLYVLEMKNAFL